MDFLKAHKYQTAYKDEKNPLFWVILGSFSFKLDSSVIISCDCHYVF